MREEIKHYLTFKVFVLIATIYLDSQGSVLVAIYYIILKKNKPDRVTTRPDCVRMY